MPSTGPVRVVGSPGCRVGYPSLTGCYAQYVACPAERLAPIPAGLARTDAAAVPVDGLTAEQGLADVLGAGAGDHVLITAAAGGSPITGSRAAAT